ncbi:hypothetical protein IFM89_019879 [Coptis chinensis]|uniref:F-box associated beta-propeller type 3 domain-containing protein n=1 Tax=Coptis chinensis TaxID=261450 RepID=A0A835LEZ2_9MAGN|nr:hypothetical protein IFM89_019879 [Coptis chinensis]
MCAEVENSTPSSESMVKIADSLSLTTNQGLLMEAVALEKVKLQAEQDENDGEANIITDDPLFPELHFSLGVKNPGHVYGIRGNLCFVEKPKDTTVGIKLHDVWPTNKNQKYYLQNDCYLSTCRSLMCYLTMRDKFIHICNPITQNHIKVPIPVAGGISREDISGFGYAPQSKKYKYVRFLYRKLNNSLTATVFTLGGESWRELEHVPYPPRLGPVYCNGVLYWSTGLKAGPYFVLSFDLETEEFQKRRVFPTGTTYDRIVGVKYLVVLGENVSLVRDLPPDYLEVWTLMDEKNNIWVKKYHLRRTPKLSRIGFKLSGLWMNGDLYGMRTIKKKDGTIVKRLYSYNAESEKYTAIKLPAPS